MYHQSLVLKANVICWKEESGKWKDGYEMERVSYWVFFFQRDLSKAMLFWYQNTVFLTTFTSLDPAVPSSNGTTPPTQNVVIRRCLSRVLPCYYHVVLICSVVLNTCAVLMHNQKVRKYHIFTHTFTYTPSYTHLHTHSFIHTASHTASHTVEMWLIFRSN